MPFSMRITAIVITMGALVGLAIGAIKLLDEMDELLGELQ